MSEKEQLIAYRNRIEAQQKNIQELNELISQYEAQGNAADCILSIQIYLEKIAALNQIHQDKVRNLMNSIQVLKKENAQLKNLGKEHKRSQLIEQLNQEIKDQDLAMEVLRKIINNDQQCDNEIVKALNQGPPKVKSLTREELKIEVKRLQSQIILMKEQAKKDMNNNSVTSNASTRSNQSLQAKEIFDKRIQELSEQNSNLLSEKGALEENVDHLNKQLDQKSQQIRELSESKSNLIILNKKYEFLQQQIKEYQLKDAGQQFEDINKELAFEEQKIINKAQENKMETVEKQLKRELDLKVIEKEQVTRELEKAKEDISQLIKKFNTLNKRYTETMEELNKTKGELQKQIQMYQQLDQSTKLQINQLTQDIQERDNTIQEGNIKIEELNQEIDKLQDGIRSLEVDLQRYSAQQQNNADKQYDIEINKKIQSMLKQQQTDNPQELKVMMVKQQKYYEEAMKMMQNKLNKQEDQLSDISSNISQLVKLEDGDNLDLINSDISQFQKNKQDDVDSNIQDIPSDMDSSVSQFIQQAPKQQRKQVDSPSISKINSSVGSLQSSQSKIKQSDLDNISSSVSDARKQSLSKISSNLSKISFTSSMQRQKQ